MSGEQFAKNVYQRVYEESKTVHIIKQNHDKSKHLETACIKLYDLELDLVNLRNETYNETSRVPEI